MIDTANGVSCYSAQINKVRILQYLVLYTGSTPCPALQLFSHVCYYIRQYPQQQISELSMMLNHHFTIILLTAYGKTLLHVLCIILPLSMELLF